MSMVEPYVPEPMSYLPGRGGESERQLEFPMRILFSRCFYPLLISATVVGSAALASLPISSADGTSTVSIVDQPIPGTDPYDGPFTLKLTAHGKEILKLPTHGYILSAFWSPDGKYVAINNRRDNSGDYLWVISMTNGKVVKAPDEIPAEVFADRAARTFPQTSVRNFRKYFNLAKGWTGGDKLKVESSLFFDGLKNAMIRRTALYEIKNNEFIQVREAFEMVMRPKDN